MDKAKIKYIGAEVLLMLVCCLEAGMAFAAQMVGRTPLGVDTSFLFASTAYEYDTLVYACGWGLYAVFVFVAFWFFKLKVTAPHAPGGKFKLLAILVAVALAALTGVGLIFESFMFLGMGGSMRPELLMYLSVIGMPAAALAGMIYNILRRERV